MSYIKRSHFNRVFISGFGHSIKKSDGKYPYLKLMVSQGLNSPEANIIEVYIYKRSLIDSCESWFGPGSSIIVEGFISVSLIKDDVTKHLINRKQYIRVDRIMTINDGLEYY